MRRVKEAANDKLTAASLQHRVAQWERECSNKQKAYAEACKVSQQLKAELDNQQRRLAEERSRWAEVSERNTHFQHSLTHSLTHSGVYAFAPSLAAHTNCCVSAWTLLAAGEEVEERAVDHRG